MERSSSDFGGARSLAVLALARCVFRFPQLGRKNRKDEDNQTSSDNGLFGGTTDSV